MKAIHAAEHPAEVYVSPYQQQLRAYQEALGGADAVAVQIAEAQAHAAVAVSDDTSGTGEHILSCGSRRMVLFNPFL